MRHMIGTNILPRIYVEVYKQIQKSKQRLFLKSMLYQHVKPTEEFTLHTYTTQQLNHKVLGGACPADCRPTNDRRTGECSLLSVWLNVACEHAWRQQKASSLSGWQWVQCFCKSTRHVPYETLDRAAWTIPGHNSAACFKTTLLSATHGVFSHYSHFQARLISRNVLSRRRIY